LSFDGRTGGKTFGKPLPNALSLTKIEINAGRSTQATLLNREEYTYEAIYLSPSLTERIDMCRVERQNYQSELFVYE
jgi:DNA adenine methylase